MVFSILYNENEVFPLEDIIEQVQHEILERPIAVYNFEVEDYHTYYVSKQNVLVHNSNCGYKPTKGGGGVTSSVKVGDKTVTFGHGGRHLEGTGLTVNQVNTAIANDVVTRPAVYNRSCSVDI